MHTVQTLSSGKAHLPPQRLSRHFTDVDNNGQITQADVLEQKTTYPFGMFAFGYRASGYEADRTDFTGHQVVGSNTDRYHASMDMQARYYSPGMASFVGVDPLADQFASHTPYAYTMNNPINLIDPDGKAPTGPPGGFGNGNGVFARLALKVQATYAALVDKVSLTLFSRRSFTISFGGNGNASGSTEIGTESSVTFGTNLQEMLTYHEGKKPSLDGFGIVKTSESNYASTSVKIPVGPGNVGGSTSSSTDAEGNTSTSQELSAGASAGNLSAKVFTKNTQSETGESTRSSGAEVKVNTTSQGANLQFGARVKVNHR